MKPIKKRKEFFESLEAGLQAYFDQHDPEWGGILHLTIGVRFGEVGGIIKSENTLRYEGYSRQRIETILRYVLPRYVSRTQVPYAVDDVINELLGIKTAEDEPKAEVVQVTADPLPEEKPKKRRPTRKQETAAELLRGAEAPVVATDALPRRPSMEGLAEAPKKRKYTKKAKEHGQETV